MTSKRTFRHTHSFAPPHHLRQGLLVVLDGAPGSGKTSQLERIREAQHRLFHVPPVFVELAPDVQSPESVAQRLAALTALAAGRTVFAERWAYDDAVPDLLLLSMASFTGAQLRPRPWGVVPRERRVELPDGHEGIVGVEMWTAMAARRFYGSCLCQVST